MSQRTPTPFKDLPPESKALYLLAWLIGIAGALLILGALVRLIRAVWGWN
jgi:hypothetical protein